MSVLPVQPPVGRVQQLEPRAGVQGGRGRGESVLLTPGPASPRVLGRVRGRHSRVRVPDWLWVEAAGHNVEQHVRGDTGGLTRGRRGRGDTSP